MHLTDSLGGKTLAVGTKWLPETLGCRGPGLKLNSCNKLHTRQSVPLGQVAQTINPVKILRVAMPDLRVRVQRRYCVGRLHFSELSARLSEIIGLR